MSTSVTFRWQAQRVTLLPGDLIGRHGSCAFRVPDPRVSEAHAMVAVRRGALVLLNLRGGLVREGKRVTDPRLVVGTTLSLATGVDLLVEAVQLPERLWALDTPEGLVPVEPVVSLLDGPVRAVARREREAVRTVWTDGETCFDGDRELKSGDEVRLGDWCATVRWMQRPAAQGAPTQQRRLGALALYARFHSVAVHDAGALVLTVKGVPARILHELIELGGPVAWSVLAREIWDDGATEAQLRRRWDAALLRLRRQLAAAGLRDLVVSDGCGHVEIHRQPGDRFVVDG